MLSFLREQVDKFLSPPVVRNVRRWRSRIFYVEDRPAAATGAPGTAIIGTAFSVSPGLLLTARHVVEEFRPRDLSLRSVYKADGSKYALGIPFQPDDLIGHPRADIAAIRVPLLRTKGRDSSLSVTTPSVGASMTVIGFPEGTDLVFLDDIWGEGSPKGYVPVCLVGNVAALVPGDDARPIESIVYACTTFPGLSGAPVFCGKSGSIIAIHTHGDRSGNVGYGAAFRHAAQLTSASAIHG